MQSSPIGRWLLGCAGVSLASCYLLVDREADQCTSDADCSAFADAHCDLATATCVGRGSGGAGGSAGGGGEMGGGGAGGGDPCTAVNKPVITVEGDITANDTWLCQNDYLLKGRVFVTPDVTLSIEAGTTIKGKFSSDPLNAAVLVVQPGGALNAVGTADRPIVFTSEKEPQFRVAGDWGGVIILGRARVNEVAPIVEGVTMGGEYGGNDDDDSSGVLRYLRIEYGGTIIGSNNEINGLTFGGVGRGTEVDHIQVRQTLDDCFEFFGGTVNASHLVCQGQEDDGIDWDLGYRGKLQFVVVQHRPNIDEAVNGIEADNSSETALPVSAPTVYNITLIGDNATQASLHYGMVLREWTDVSVFNALVMGYDYGFDVRDDGSGITVGNSIFYGQVLDDIAEDESAADDDAGFDEVAHFNANGNSTADPGISIADALDSSEFKLSPPTALVGGAATPPDDGFLDASATFIGAVRDSTDTWVTEGEWVIWSQN
jgi:hypothetical protein